MQNANHWKIQWHNPCSHLSCNSPNIAGYRSLLFVGLLMVPSTSASSTWIKPLRIQPIFAELFSISCRHTSNPSTVISTIFTNNVNTSLVLNKQNLNWSLLFVFKLVLLSWLEVWSWAWSIKISNYPPVPILGYLLMITLYLSAEMLTLGDVNQSQTSPERHKYQDNAPPPPSPDHLPPHSGGGWVLSTPDLMRHIFDFQNKLMGSNYHNTLYWPCTDHFLI